MLRGMLVDSLRRTFQESIDAVDTEETPRSISRAVAPTVVVNSESRQGRCVVSDLREVLSAESQVPALLLSARYKSLTNYRSFAERHIHNAINDLGKPR